MKRVVAVTGASGFVGREAVRALRERGAAIIALGRQAAATELDPGVEWRLFDPNGAPNPAAFEGADEISPRRRIGLGPLEPAEEARHRSVAHRRNAHAGGEPPAARAEAVGARSPSSAVGYYGDRGDEPLTERSATGSGFLAGVCAGWEEAARECEALGVRTVRVRTGVVLGEGGALAELPFKFFAGGPLGTGRQFVP